MRKSALVFTINNWTETQYQQVLDLNSVYLIVAKEIAPETQTPHLQGYVYFKSKMSIKSLSKKLPTAHIEFAKGTAEQNRTYITKTPEFYERGVIPHAGKRTDIDSIKQLVKTPGTTQKQLFETATSYQSLKFGLIGLSLYPSNELRDVKVYWFHGKSGTGKTHAVYELTKADNPYWHSTCKWFQGYDAHKTVIFDDFRPNWFPYPYLLRLLDKYPMQVENKGASTYWTPLTIYITAPQSPQELYQDEKEDSAQLLRRITEIKEFI